MPKVRVFHPRNGKQQAFNTDHITKWFTDQLVDPQTYESATGGFSIHIFTDDGRETVIYHDQGGKELLEVLENEFFPLNEDPEQVVCEERQP